MEYHIYYRDELLRFQTGTSKMFDSKIDLKVHIVEVVKSQIATSLNSNFHSEQEGHRKQEVTMVGKYKVITLCGSTRFKEQFMEAQKRLTLAGYIVISVGLFGHAGDQEVWDGMDEGTLSKTKEMLDDMHKRKIDMADEIYVINVGGYIGDSTRSEIQYAEEHGKNVRYYEDTRKDEMLRQLAEARQHIADGKCKTGDQVAEDLGKKYGFI